MAAYWSTMNSVALKQQLITHMDSLGQGFSEGISGDSLLRLIMSGAKLRTQSLGLEPLQVLLNHISGGCWVLNWDYLSKAHLHSVSAHVLSPLQYGGWVPAWVSRESEWASEPGRSTIISCGPVLSLFLLCSVGCYCCRLVVSDSQ